MSSLNYPQSSFNLVKPTSFHQMREKERFELSTLNDKFADYVEKVRYLEGNNKQIQMTTKLLTEKQDENHQKMKTLFETELEQLKKTAKQLYENKNTIFNNSQNAQNSISSSKQNFDQIFRENDLSKYENEKLERHLSTVEGDILMYKRRLIHQDNEHTHWKQFLSHIQRLLLQAKNEIHNENFRRTSTEQRVKQLHIDINHLNEQQENKLKELKQSSFILNSNSINDGTHIFKSELSNAIRKIRQDFDKQNDLHRNQLYLQFTQSYENILREYPQPILYDHERIKQEEGRVRSELQRIRTENNLLKEKISELKLRIRELELNHQMHIEENKRIEQIQFNQMKQMKLKHDKTKDDYDEVITKQISLEKEIGTYRNLLEDKMKPVIDHINEGLNTTTIPNNQYHIDHNQNLITNRKPSKSSETNSFVSYMTWENKKHSKDSLNMKTKEGSIENLNYRQNIETTDNLSPRNPRVPIVIQTRRNN